MKKLAGILILSGMAIFILLIFSQIFIVWPLSHFAIDDKAKTPYYFYACSLLSLGLILLGGIILVFVFRKEFVSEIKSILNS